MTSAAIKWIGDVESIVGVSCRFSGTVRVGDTATIRGVGSLEPDRGRLSIEAVQQDHRVGLSQAAVEYVINVGN